MLQVLQIILLHLNFIRIMQLQVWSRQFIHYLEQQLMLQLSLLMQQQAQSILNTLFQHLYQNGHR
ncbi:MAG: hypothetical protein EBR82_37700 [Caulobacteraceae bacterium]|nr:hypothetical protein [Caulobacteraceae bacterium]